MFPTVFPTRFGILRIQLHRCTLEMIGLILCDIIKTPKEYREDFSVLVYLFRIWVEFIIILRLTSAVQRLFTYFVSF